MSNNLIDVQQIKNVNNTEKQMISLAYFISGPFLWKRFL